MRFFMLKSGSPQESRFPRFAVCFKQVATLLGIGYDGKVGVGLRILRDASKAVEESARINTDETVNTYIPYVSLMTGNAILDVAVFFNSLTTRAFIKFIANLNCDQVPLRSSVRKILSAGHREDVGFQQFEIL